VTRATTRLPRKSSTASPIQPEESSSSPPTTAGRNFAPPYEQEIRVVPGESLLLRRDDQPGETRPVTLLAVEDRALLIQDPRFPRPQRYSRWLGYRYFSVKPWPWYVSLEDLARVNGPATDPYLRGQTYFQFN
jgi:hypothetical protein